MRHVTISGIVLFSLVGATGAFATPFEPATVPDQVDAVGHLDFDALRKTQVFTATNVQKEIDSAVAKVPADLQPLARSIAANIRGVSFWYGSETGAVYLETRDARSVAQIMAKGPTKRDAVVDGIQTYRNRDDKNFLAAVGDTAVLADGPESLARSIHALTGKGPNLAGSSKLPVSARNGVFVFVTIGSDALSSIQKSAHSKVLQLGIKGLVIDVGESNGVVIARAHAEMGSVDALQKAKIILEGMRALAQVSADPPVRSLLDGITLDAKGLELDAEAKIPVSELTKAIQAESHD